MAEEAFSIDKRPLRDLLQQVEDGRAQLPEFQRGWVWPYPNIASLLASISLGYPLGTLMTLRAGGDVRFKYRPIEGATLPGPREPESLVLDGQQRLTSLFQSLKLNRPVATQDVRKQAVSGWFYVDMRKVLDGFTDREDAIRFQLIPLAAVLAAAGNAADPAGAQRKLARWYWCGVFGELYGGSTETRFSQDLPDVVEWIRGSDQEPRTVTAAQFAPGRLLTLRTRQSAAYKGIYALLLKAGAADWRTGEPVKVTDYFDEAVDIHHIFPKAWCEQNGFKPEIYNSIVNKTPLTARTNRIIGSQAPSAYLAQLAKTAEIGPEDLDAHVRTHVAGPALMRSDDFDGFFSARKAALLAAISGEMGKAILTDAESDADAAWES